MTIQRQTKHRKLILQLLGDTDGYDLPPYSASTLHYMAENAFNLKWEGYDLDRVPSEQQIRRTLRDLAKAGLIVSVKVLEEPISSVGYGLPKWVNRWQLAEQVDHNQLLADVKAICWKVQRAKYGVSFFGGEPFDYGALPEQVAQWKTQVKTLMQKTHPDKATGYTEEFKQLKDCMSMIRSGIPLPTDKPPKADVKLKQLG